jgi:hypothetical protein
MGNALIKQPVLPCNKETNPIIGKIKFTTGDAYKILGKDSWKRQILLLERFF